MLDKKKIYKNTIFLYMRMLILMALSIYTSRLFLEVLGVEDYGIYNIVGGIIVLFSFITNAITLTTTRYINCALGEGNKEKLKSTFSTILTVHLWLAILLVVLGETIGLWFLNTTLNIPSNKMYAANWVYQLSILATVMGIMGAPFSGAIIANERMNIYAYLSIVEAVFKLVILFCLFYVKSHVLIWYATLFFISQTLLSCYQWIYSARHFFYCKLKFTIDKQQIGSIFRFSWWSLFGQLAYVASSTGVNMVINIFCGVVVNAAIGLGNQVNSIIYRFVSSFQTSFQPQLIQTHASNDLEAHRNLIISSSKISFFLLMMLGMPVCFNIQYLLNIWLTEVPTYTDQISILIIIMSAFECLGMPLWTSMQANGKIKNYQLTVSSINASTIFVSYLVLKMGFSPIYVFIAQIVIQFIIYVYRIFYILPRVGLKIKKYIFECVLPNIGLTFSLFVCMILIMKLELSPLSQLLGDSMFSLILTVIMAYKFAIDSEERNKLNKLLLKYPIISRVNKLYKHL